MSRGGPLQILQHESLKTEEKVHILSGKTTQTYLGVELVGRGG